MGKDYVKEIERLTAVIDAGSVDNDIIPVLLKRGQYYLLLSPAKWGLAIDDFTKVIDASGITHGQKMSALLNRAKAYKNMSPAHEDKAISDYTSVINMPNVSENHKAVALINRANIYIFMSPPQLDEAVAGYSLVINSRSSHVDHIAVALKNRGVAFQNMSPPQMDEAISDYTEVINMEDVSVKYRSSAFYLRALAYSFGDDPDYEKALEDMEQAKKLGHPKADYYVEKLKSDLENQKAGRIANKIKDILEYKESSITHYTSLRTAKILLMPDRESPSCFRLSNAVHLNDPSEGNAVLDYLCEKRDGGGEPFAERVPNAQFFVGSFVPGDASDELTLWRMYGKEEQEEAKGCSITFKISLIEPESGDGESGLQIETEVERSERKLFRVAYFDGGNFYLDGKKCKELKSAFEDLRDVVKDMPRYKLQEAVFLNEIRYLVKHSHYRHESECRVVIPKVAHSEDIQWRNDTEIPQSYVELTLDPRDHVEAVTVGPKVPQAEEWAAAFKIKIDSHRGENAVEVRVSKIPFK